MLYNVTLRSCVSLIIGTAFLCILGGPVEGVLGCMVGRMEVGVEGRGGGWGGGQQGRGQRAGERGGGQGRTGVEGRGGGCGAV